MIATGETFASFDFGLSADEESRAARLHRESTVIDLAFSGPVTHRSFGAELEAELEERWRRRRDPLLLGLSGMHRPAELAADGDFAAYEDNWRSSGITAATRLVELASLEVALMTFGAVRRQCAELPWLVEARSAADIRRAKAAGGAAVLAATQLIGGPGPDLLGALGSAHALGLRMLQLTYNTMTVVGAGCTERGDVGLSGYGVRVVRRMNELGMLVDTAHCGRRTTLDACEVSERPVVASHAAAYGVHPHVRNKRDDELEAVAATGGLIGVVAVPFFLSPDPEASVSALLDHVDYLVRLVGVEHVGIGTDWPFPLPKRLLNEAVGSLAHGTGFAEGDIAAPSRNLDGFDDYRDFPNITRGLVARGYGDAEVSAILGENALRIIAEVCGD